MMESEVLVHYDIISCKFALAMLSHPNGFTRLRDEVTTETFSTGRRRVEVLHLI